MLSHPLTQVNKVKQREELRSQHLRTWWFDYDCLEPAWKGRKSMASADVAMSQNYCAVKWMLQYKNTSTWPTIDPKHTPFMSHAHAFFLFSWFPVVLKGAYTATPQKMLVVVRLGGNLWKRLSRCIPWNPKHGINGIWLVVWNMNFIFPFSWG